MSANVAAPVSLSARGPAPYPVHLVESSALRDGTPVTIRPICRTDLRHERAFVEGLSDQTRYQRLLSGRRLQPDEIRRLSNIDYGHELALVAVARIDGRDRIVGEARYVRDEGEEPDRAEFAIVIGDAWQGHGLGEALLRRLMRAAADDGLKVLAGLTLSDNARMIALARKFGFRARRDPGYAGVTELRCELGDARADALDGTPGFDEALLWAAA
jgi:acetyltransferase